MDNVDRFDTPDELAKRMLTVVAGFEHEVIADFAVGGGALLGAAEQQWPDSQIFGVDISAAVIKDLSKTRETWCLIQADFLGSDLLCGHEVLRSIKDRASLVLLNPPFSCKGAKTLRVKSGSFECQSSVAMAFVLKSLQFLNKQGHLVAVLPAGVLRSIRDRRALDFIHQNYKFDVVEECDRRMFEGCSVRTIIAHVAPRADLPNQIFSSRTIHRLSSPKQVKLIRGKIQMHSIAEASDQESLPLIHTTELIDFELKHSGRRARANGAVSGPIILVPRVGEPKKSKVVMATLLEKSALSDCVIGILGEASDLDQVYGCLLANWDELAGRYGGSCARYITISELARFLDALGCKVELPEQALRNCLAAPPRSLRGSGPGAVAGL